MSMKIPLLLFLLGSLSLCALAEEASTPVSEDEAATADLGDSMVSEAPTEGVMTTDSVLSTGEDGSENATDSTVPETSDDGLETATMAGIIVGIIAAIGVATGIIVLVVKKVSGRYSP